MSYKNFKMDNVVHLRLPHLMLDKLNEESFATGLSKQELIRAAIKSMLEKKYDKDLFMEHDQIKPNYKNNEKLF